MQGLLKERYQIHNKIGQGGMGAVWEATDQRLQRKVAIKVLPTLDEPERIHRFMLEAQAIAQLNHPNIVTIYDYDHDQNNQPFIVMELVPGSNIGRAHFQSLSQVLDALIQVCAGLAYAHKEKVIHRDLKPENIRLTPDGQIRIMDFGLATFAGRPRMTNTGMLVGTFAYMAPEQAIGGAVDERTDLYAVGLVIYELLTGQLPFHGENSLGLLYDRLHRIPTPVRKLRPEIPPRLEAVVQKTLAKLPDQRFQNALALRDALVDIRATLPKDKRHSIPTLEVNRVSAGNPHGPPPEYPTEELPLSELSPPSGASELYSQQQQQQQRLSQPARYDPDLQQTAIPGGQAQMPAAAGGLPASREPHLSAQNAPAHFSALNTPFVGRHKELESLRHLLDSVSQAQGGCVLIGGDPGSGRSTLMDALVQMAEPYPILVWRNRCIAEIPDPLQPFVQILRNDLRNRPAGQLSATQTPPEDLSLLATLIPDLATFSPGSGAPAESALDSERSRGEILAALVNFIERRAHDTPIILILEEVNEADPDTILAVRQLIASARTNPIGLVMTYSRQSLSRAHPLHAMLFGADRESSPIHHSLERFTLEETTQLVQLHIPHSPTDLAGAIHGATDGHPLFVNATLLALQGQTEQSGEAISVEPRPELLPIPDIVRESFERIFAELSESAQAVLTRASIFGHTFEFDLLEAIAELDEDTLIDGLEEGLKRRLIHALEEERYHFDSVFIWRLIYEKTHPRRRARFHDRVGELLEERRSGSESLPEMLELAHHFSAGATRKDPSRAVDYLLRAADLQTHLDPRKAGQLIDQALDLMERSELELPELRAQAEARLEALAENTSE